jgi:hypothetical protein
MGNLNPAGCKNLALHFAADYFFTSTIKLGMMPTKVS